MCKFETSDDVNYCTLRNRIKVEIQSEDVALKTARQSRENSWELKMKARQETQSQLHAIRDQLATGDLKLDQIQSGT
jgi:multidrug resistance efflux pump